MTTMRELTDEDLDDLLQDDYRRLLRWYPRSWRDSYGEALLGTLLDEADATDRFMVQPGEWRAFASAGTAARLDRVIARPIRDALSTVLLSIGAGAGPVASVFSRARASAGSDTSGVWFGPAQMTGPVLAALWIAALIAAAGGRWWIGRIALLLSVVVAALTGPLGSALSLPPVSLLEAGALTTSVVAAALATLGAPRGRLPLVAAAIGWAALT